MDRQLLVQNGQLLTIHWPNEDGGIEKVVGTVVEVETDLSSNSVSNYVYSISVESDNYVQDARQTRLSGLHWATERPSNTRKRSNGDLEDSWSDWPGNKKNGIKNAYDLIFTETKNSDASLTSCTVCDHTAKHGICTEYLPLKSKESQNGSPITGSRMSMEIRQLGKHQDQGYIGSVRDSVTNEPVDYIEVFDGHGENQCINAIRSMDHNSLISHYSCPEFELQCRLDSMGDRIPIGSGSTYCLAKMFNDRIECTSVGDSQIMIFVNGERRYRNTIHNGDNSVERDRLRSVCRAQRENRHALVSSTRMAQVETVRLRFHVGINLMPSQSLGHHNITGIVPERYTLFFQPDDDVRVIVASDGFWDMVIEDGQSESDDEKLLHSTAAELVDMANRRWAQEWIILDPLQSDPSESTGSYDSSDYDDVVVCVWEKSKSGCLGEPSLARVNKYDSREGSTTTCSDAETM